MRDQLQYLSASLRSIDLATSPEQVVQALNGNLAELLPGATITITLDVSGALPILAQNAIGTQTPQISDNNCHVAIPLVVEGRVRGVVLVELSRPPIAAQ